MEGVIKVKEIIIDKEEFKKRLIDKEGEMAFYMMFERCLQIDKILIPVLNEWSKTGTVKNITIEGFTMERLLNICGSFSAALINADLLIKNTEETKELLKRLEEHERLIM